MSIHGRTTLGAKNAIAVRRWLGTIRGAARASGASILVDAKARTAQALARRADRGDLSVPGWVLRLTVGAVSAAIVAVLGTQGAPAAVQVVFGLP